MGIKAEIHGKISSKGTNITDTLEDLLTSNVFQLLRYMSLEKGLMLVLNEATNIQGDKFTLLEDISEAEFCFWEKFDNCEPDILIKLKQGSVVYANIMVEAKYLSGKSGSAIYINDEDEGEDTYIAGSDHLEKQWSALKVYSGKVPHYLIYLTMDWVMPLPAIKESIRASSDDVFSKHMYWINWQSIHKILNTIIEKDQMTLSCSEEKIISDILALLEKKGLVEFTGYRRVASKNLEPFSYFTPQFYIDVPKRLFERISYFEEDNDESR